MDLKDATVLLVDDEVMLRELICHWLGRAVGEVVGANNGVEALQVLATRKIDLVLSDVRMPVMDGITLLKKINEAPGHRPRLIFITGFSDLSLRTALDLGAEAILEKPFERADLLQAARRSLADLDELWRAPQVAEAQDLQLKIGFESLDAALQEKRIAFGRRGFCVETPDCLHTGPIAFTLDLKADGRVISGQGVVRWTAQQGHQAGIEIMHLDDAGRAWMIHWMQRNQTACFIPGSTESAQSSKPQVA